MTPLPQHVRLVHSPVLRADCRRCGARAYIGKYEDPTRADTLLNAWIARHAHGEPE